MKEKMKFFSIIDYYTVCQELITLVRFGQALM